ncbi:MAG TPA: S41 family peptidase [Thermoanaerobaculia bacterium]|nr:S41 family peptidase [Thermoanaerobaculia bacterium]
MNRSRTVLLVVSLALVVPILAGTLLAASSREDDSTDSLYKYLAVFTETLTRVRENYVDPPDVDQLLVGALDGATDALDPFSLYVPPEAVDRFVATRGGGLPGGLLLLKEHGVMYVAGAPAESAAGRAGLRIGDVVAEIGGKSTRVMPLWQAQQMLAAAGVESVDLKVIRFGEMRSVSLALARYDPPVPTLREVRGVPVLRIAGFASGTGTAVERALAELTRQGQGRLLLDLRGTLTGDAEVAYRVAGLFARGEIGSLVRRGEKADTFSGKATPAWQGKIGLLVDRGTLGAAEVLASVLKQKASARLIGERTFGYAGHQEMVELSTGGRLLYTDAFYSGPDGKLLRGSLIPDVRVEDFSFGEPEGEAPSDKDPILDRGIEVLLAEEPAAAQAA